jgi:Tol biopolymer transport system component
MPRTSSLWMLGCVVAVACTKRNPDVCCETATECKTVGFSSAQPCDEGVCVNYSCVATGCDGNEDCRDPDQPMCVAGRCYGPADACREGGGSRILFISSRSAIPEIYGMYVNGTAQESLGVAATPDSNSEYNLSMSPDGKSVAFLGGIAGVSNGGISVCVAGADGQNPRQITNELAEQENNVVWSPDGAMLAFSNRLTYKSAYVITADGADRFQLTGGFSDSSYDPSWSPDSKKIVFASSSSGSGDIAIWTATANGASPQVLDQMQGGTFDPGVRFLTPRWSPDGATVAYLTSYPEDRDIFLKSVGGGPSTPFKTVGVDESDIVWSHDGSKLTFVRGQGTDLTNRTIWVMNADGTNQKNLTSGTTGDRHPRWSPDDHYILFDTIRDGNREVYRMDSDGANPVNLTNYRGLDDGSGDDFSAEWAACSL